MATTIAESWKHGFSHSQIVVVCPKGRSSADQKDKKSIGWSIKGQKLTINSFSHSEEDWHQSGLHLTLNGFLYLVNSSSGQPASTKASYKSRLVGCLFCLNHRLKPSRSRRRSVQPATVFILSSNSLFFCNPRRRETIGVRKPENSLATWLKIREQLMSGISLKRTPVKSWGSALHGGIGPEQELKVCFVLRKKGSKMRKRMKEEEIEKGDCGPPNRKFRSCLRFCRTWTKRYLGWSGGVSGLVLLWFHFSGTHILVFVEELWHREAQGHHLHELIFTSFAFFFFTSNSECNDMNFPLKCVAALINGSTLCSRPPVLWWPHHCCLSTRLKFIESHAAAAALGARKAKSTICGCLPRKMAVVAVIDWGYFLSPACHSHTMIRIVWLTTSTREKLLSVELFWKKCFP